MSPRPLQLAMAVSHCARSPHNTGIQRVVRGLARHVAAQHSVRFVEWRAKRGAFYLVHPGRFDTLAQFGGPPPPQQPLFLSPRRTPPVAWLQGLGLNHLVPLHHHPDFVPTDQERWLILPELVDEERMDRMMRYARQYGWRVGAVFYDAIPLLHPEWVNERILKNHAGYMRDLAQADVVWPISEFSAGSFRDFVAREQLAQPRVEACQLPGEWLNQPRVLTTERPENGPVRALCLCTLEPRKNHRTLLAALEQLLDLDWELTLVGNAYKGAPEIEAAVRSAMAKNSRLRWLQQVDDEAVRGLYARSDFTVFPSLIEGFGLPIMESLWNARPCLCANGGVMQELAREGGCWTVDVKDPAALAAGLRALITDQNLRRRLAEEATQRRMKTWNDYAAEILVSLRSRPDSKATS